MTRIIIIGNGGTGKSTLGDRLSKILDIEVTHLDKITFDPGWIRIEEDIFRKNLGEIMEKENWIIEGWSYHSTLKLRLDASTIIIYLKYSILFCYWNALKRHVKYSHKQNPYDPPESPMLKKTGRMIKAMWKVYKEYEPELQKLLNEMDNSKSVIVFESRRELNNYLRNVETNKFII